MIAAFEDKYKNHMFSTRELPLSSHFQYHNILGASLKA